MNSRPPNDEPPYLVSDALPDGVFFFVTCRPGDRLARFEERLFAIPHRFHDLGPLSLGDMRSVLLSRKPDITSAEVERIAEVSQGNPLYLHAIADRLSRQPAYNLKELPATIDGFFRSSSGLLRSENAVLRDVLGLLSVARSSLSVCELSAIAGYSQREIDEQGIRPNRTIPPLLHPYVGPSEPSADVLAQDPVDLAPNGKVYSAFTRRFSTWLRIAAKS